MAKLYPGEWIGDKRLFIRTGEYRMPKQGEYYLSGAIPVAYRAPHDFTAAEYYIMRPATETESVCPCCGRRYDHV